MRAAPRERREVGSHNRGKLPEGVNEGLVWVCLDLAGLLPNLTDGAVVSFQTIVVERILTDLISTVSQLSVLTIPI